MCSKIFWVCIPMDFFSRKLQTHTLEQFFFPLALNLWEVSFKHCFILRWEEFLEVPRLEVTLFAVENAWGQLSSCSGLDQTGRGWLNETDGWWGRDKYMRWIFNISFSFLCFLPSRRSRKYIISLSSREQNSKKILYYLEY